jgi:hypothetical protein
MKIEIECEAINNCEKNCRFKKFCPDLSVTIDGMNGNKKIKKG